MSRDTHVLGGDTTAELAGVSVPRSEVGVLHLLPLAGAAQAIEPSSRSTTLGRDETCDVVLDSPAVSRVHARIEWGPAGALLMDLESTNGTFVDGERVASSMLNHGAIVRIGSAVFRAVRLTEAWRDATSDGALVGGVSLAPVRRQIGLVGPTELAVLVHGETGTGKELVARALHEASRRGGPFIPLNCAALPETLVESELFGHVRGAFTGAAASRRGLFHAAAGGTLFLDEVGDLPLAAQAKLLRVLEDRVVRPVGAESGGAVDVRIVSATHRNLADESLSQRFRSDLYARLAAIEVHLPPLRDRMEDLGALCRHLLGRAGLAASTEIEPEALEAMALYEWPMNVRELDSVLRAAVLAHADRISLASLPSRVRERSRPRRVREPSQPLDAPGPITWATAGRARVVHALTENRGNARRTAKDLGISRNHLYRLFRRWGIDPQRFRDGAGGPGAC